MLNYDIEYEDKLFKKTIFEGDNKKLNAIDQDQIAPKLTWPIADCVKLQPCKMMLNNLMYQNKHDLDSYTKYNSNEDILLTTCINKNMKITEHTPNKTANRISPQMKIANMITFLEKEMFPLKNMLNEILRNCSTLDLPQFTFKEMKTFQNTGVNIIDHNNDKYKKFDPIKYNKNRVVYSVICDI